VLASVGVLNFDLRGHPAVSFEMMNRGPREKNISSKLPFGVSLSGLPQQLSASRQGNREDSHYDRANGYNLGVIFSDELKKLSDKAIFFSFVLFFFVGALIGFFL
jgi:hypothetical protein